MTAAVCPVCGAVQRDTVLCPACLREIAAALELVMPDGGPVRAVAGRAPSGACARSQAAPWERGRQSWAGVEAELDVTLSRASRAGLSLSRGRSAESPLPYDLGASKAADALREVLARRVRHLHAVHAMPAEAWPVDTVAALAGWLLDRLALIRADLDAAAMHAEIVQAVGRALFAIDRGQAEALSAAASFDRLGDGVDAYLYGREARELLNGYGLPVSKQRLANWIRRGRLLPATTDRGGRPLYRLREVEALARRGNST